ncbi:U7 snRNA-associated Sm-like protein LSm11 isoform 2-T2 [Discoglossus pictus]
MEHTGRREAPAVQATAGEHSDSMAEEDEASPGSSLDVSSEHFDPLLALYSPQTPLPYPGVRCFNNLAEYESFLRTGGRSRPRGARGTQRGGRKGRKPEPDPERIERLKKLMLPEEERDTPARPRKNRTPKNVLTRMPLHAGSPLGELNRCVQDRLRIKVHIRTFKGLRGVCSGFIVAFDKFWNMAMVDVDETYRKPVLGKAYYNEPHLTLTRLFDRLKLQESGSQPSTELQDTALKRPTSPRSQPRPRQGRSTERRRTRSSSRGREKIGTQSSERTVGTGEEDSKSRGREKSRTRRRSKKSMNPVPSPLSCSP